MFGERADLEQLAAFGAGVDDILTVPFAPEELLARVIVVCRPCAAYVEISASAGWRLTPFAGANSVRAGVCIHDATLCTQRNLARMMTELSIAARAPAEPGRPPHKTLAQWAAIRLREMIAHSQLPAGQRIYENDLAARMGISRTPVRQALRQLEHEGLVSIRANRETVVTDFTPTDVREIFQFRAAIEGMAAALAAQKAGRGQSVSGLFQILGRMRAALAAEQPSAYLELDIAFHDAVVDACDNSRLTEARKRVRDQTRRYLVFPLRYLSVDNLHSNLRQHAAIAEAIQHGDTDLAEKLMRVHITSNGERIADAMIRTVAF